MTQDRHIAVWNNCLHFIQQNIEPQQFNIWFRPIKPVSLAECGLTVEVPSEFFREYLEGAYGIGQISSTQIKDYTSGLFTQVANEEGRGWQRMLVEIDGKEVAIYNAHLSYVGSSSLKALQSNVNELKALLDGAYVKK